ncbi:FAD dependent oxidoreductase [Dacryopinax primogenitus]|uniref:FAD dependent oxidoreductase n=1 Tax=Dacryopinax primogenitus (strain DJM 731) TaxID=1858805 RepID=M5FXB1_DACPD|nr:FAD dependent oxidoreductase [Dacryopinax primogenitus]EJU02621.1 FAD dependent oxidoreductase [Dacryopinax primogenitus]
MLDHSTPIIVIGAGVFGLSTAYHLALKGYKNITVLDEQDHPSHLYSPDNGSRSASADINKIFRASYGEQVHYQELAYEAQSIWLEWDEQISRSRPGELPAGLEPEDKLVHLCGLLRLSGTGELSAHELATLGNFDLAGHRERQFSLQDPGDRERALADPEWKDRFCVFGDPAFPSGKGKGMAGVLDSTAGYVLMDKACLWMWDLCIKQGVKFSSGNQGKVLRFLTTKAEGEKEKEKVVGVLTAEGEREAGLVVVATGAYTPLLLLQSRACATATAGTLVTLQLPPSRPDLWARFDPKRFPAVIWGSGERSGLYILPRMRDGKLKFGYRGTKFTNLLPDQEQQQQQQASTPVYPSQVPELATRMVTSTIAELLPELQGVPVQSSRLCWYTDGPENEFLVDYVPGFEGLVVATCGSGHAAKHMPVLGKYVVGIIERRGTPYTAFWKWKDGGARPRNVVDLKDA